MSDRIDATYVPTKWVKNVDPRAGAVDPAMLGSTPVEDDGKGFITDVLTGFGEGTTQLVTNVAHLGAWGLSNLVNLFRDEKEYVNFNKDLVNMGASSENVSKFFNQFYSQEAQQAHKAVADAEGFQDTVAAYLLNSRAITTGIAQSLPSMLPIFKASGMAAKMAMKAGMAKKLEGEALDKFVRNRVRAAAGGAEGAVSTLSVSQAIGEENLKNGKSYGEGQGYALLAGVGTGVIGQLNPMEANMMSKGVVSLFRKQAIKDGEKVGLLKSARGAVGRAIKSGGKEGLEEVLQSDWEQIMQNLGTGEDVFAELGKVTAQGFILGGATGVGMHPLTKKGTSVADVIKSQTDSGEKKATPTPPSTGEEIDATPSNTEVKGDQNNGQPSVPPTDPSNTAAPVDPNNQSQPVPGTPSPAPGDTQQAIPTQPEIVTESDKPNTPLTPEEAARIQPGERGTAIPVPTQQTQENTNTEAIPTGEKQELDFSGMTGTKEQQKAAREKAATDTLGKDFALRHSWIYEKTAGWNSPKIQAGIVIARADEEVLSDGPGMDNKMPNEKEISTLGKYIEAYGPQGAAAELRKEGEKIVNEATTNDQINKGERLIAQAELLEGKLPEDVRNSFLQKQKERELEAQAKIGAEAKAKEDLKKEKENRKNEKKEADRIAKEREAKKVAERQKRVEAKNKRAEELTNSETFPSEEDFDEFDSRAEKVDVARRWMKSHNIPEKVKVGKVEYPVIPDNWKKYTWSELHRVITKRADMAQHPEKYAKAEKSEGNKPKKAEKPESKAETEEKPVDSGEAEAAKKKAEEKARQEAEAKKKAAEEQAEKRRKVVESEEVPDIADIDELGLKTKAEKVQVLRDWCEAHGIPESVKYKNQQTKVIPSKLDDKWEVIYDKIWEHIDAYYHPEKYNVATKTRGERKDEQLRKYFEEVAEKSGKTAEEVQAELTKVRDDFMIKGIVPDVSPDGKHKFTEEEKKILENLRGLIITTGKAEPDSGGREMKTNYTHQFTGRGITDKEIKWACTRSVQGHVEEAKKIWTRLYWKGTAYEYMKAAKSRVDADTGDNKVIAQYEWDTLDKDLSKVNDDTKDADVEEIKHRYENFIDDVKEKFSLTYEDIKSDVDDSKVGYEGDGVTKVVNPEEVENGDDEILPGLVDDREKLEQEEIKKELKDLDWSVNRTPPNKSAQGVDKVKAAIGKAWGNKFAEKLLNSGVVRLCTSEDVVETAAREASEATGKSYDECKEFYSKQIGPKTQAFYDHNTKRVYINSDLMDSERINGVIAHEIGAHLAEDTELSPEINALAQDAVDVVAKGAAEGNAICLEVQRRMREAGETSPMETLAYLAEVTINSKGLRTKESRGLFSKLIDFFNRVLKKLGINRTMTKISDIVGMVEGYTRAAADSKADKSELKPVAGNKADGTLKPISRSVKASAKPTVDEAVKSIKAHGITYDLIADVFSPEIADRLEDISQKFKKNVAFKVWTQTYQLTQDAAKLGLTTAKAVYDSMCKLESLKQKLQRDVKQIENEFVKLSKDSREKVNRYLEESTLTNKWGYKPDWVPDKEWSGTDADGNPLGNTVDPEMEKKYNTLSDAEKAVVQRVLKFGYDQGKKVEDTIENLRKNLGLTRKKRVPKFITPYVPLVRKGGILVVYKSKEYADIEKKINGISEQISNLSKQIKESKKKGFSAKALQAQHDKLHEERKTLRKKIGEMRKQEAHYVVSFQDSNREAGKIERELVSKYGDHGTVERRVVPTSSVRNPGEREKVQVYAHVQAELKSKYGEETARILGGEFNEIFSQVTERGLTDATKRRENIAGYEKNIMQGFVDHNMGLANRIANASGGLDLAQKLAECRNQLKGMSGEKQREAALYFNELESRVHKNTQYEPAGTFDKFSSGVRQLETFRLLSLKPSFYIQNGMQPTMMTYPALAARYGATVAGRAMLNAYGKYGKIIKEKLESNKSWKEKYGSLSNLVEEIIDDPKADLTEGERNMLREMINRGLIDMGVEQDFGEISQQNEYFGAVGRAAKYVSGAARAVEIVNRFTSAVASYELATKNGKMSPEAATEFVADILNRTQGDYGATNAAPIFNTKLGKLALQFRKFQVIQFSYFADQLKQALSAATPQEKAIAKRQLMYGMAVHAAMGGVMGLPAATTLMMFFGALSNAFGDDDGEDGEQMFRRNTMDFFGKTMGSIVVNGILTPFGVNMTNQVGAGTMLSLTPFSKKQLGEQDGVKEVLFSLMGPFASDVARFHDSIVNSNSENNYRPFVEAALPKGIPQMLKAMGIIDMRYNAKTGEKMFQNISNADRFWSMFGFTSETENRMYGLYGATKNVEEKRNSDYLTLKKRYLRASPRERMRIQAEWAKLNAFWYKRGFTKGRNAKELVSYLKTKGKEEANRINGVKTTSTNREFVRRTSQYY